MLITGASSGIGAATARTLARRKAIPILVGRRLDALRAVAGETGGTAVGADITSRTDRAGLVGRAGAVDVLVNNAGRGYAGEFATMPPAAIEKLISVDLTAQLELTRAVLPGMVERGRGHIVFVTSIAGATGVRGEAVYSAAKAALATFADSLRQETVRAGIRVSVVVPGVVDTPFFERRGARYDRARPRPIPAERVADAIARAIVRERAEVFVPAWMRLPARVKGCVPAFYRAMAGRFG